MWPMSHALYPELNNNTQERPTTAETQKTWYGNNFKSYASSRSSFHPERSLHSLAPEDEVLAEDLGDVIYQTRWALSVLSADEDGETGPKRPPKAANPEDRAGPSGDGISREDALVGSPRASWHDPEEPHSKPNTNSSRSAVASCPGSPDLARERISSRGSNSSTFVSLASPGDREGDTRGPPSRQSLGGGASTAGSALDGVERWKAKTASLLADSRTHQEGDQVLRPSSSNLTSNKGSGATMSTPAKDRIPAPSLTMTWESSEKAPGSIDLKALSSDNLSNHGAEQGPREEEERGQAEKEDDPTAGHLSGLPLVSLTISLSAAVFLVAMDVNVIATAVPRITGEFRSLDDVGWYGSSFLIATCATQIPYGRVYSLFPSKWVFISAILIFMLGSLVAATSANSPILIFGRAIQGVGTSGILSGGLIIISQVVPLRIRPILTSVIGAMEGVAMISAPIIGGVLTDNLNWRWCFYINLPIGGFVLLVVVFCMRNTRPVGRRRQAGATLLRTLYELDLLGAAALLPPIVCTLLALHYAGLDGHSWGDASVILLLVLGLVLFCIFAYTQHFNAEVAMLPFRVVKHRSILAGFWFILCTSSALVVITYFLPLWFQTIKQSSAQQSGIGILPMLVAVIGGVLGSGTLVTFFGYYMPFMVASSILMPIGLGLLTTIGPDTHKAALIVYPALFGLGVGVGFQQPLIGVQATLPAADVAPGTTVIVFGQTIGAAIMVAVGESVFQNRLVTNLADYLGLTNIDSQQLLGTGASSLQSLVPTEKVPALIEAVSASLTQTFYVAVAIASLSGIGCLFMEWKSVKQRKRQDEEGGRAGEPSKGIWKKFMEVLKKPKK